jgi:predicted DNA binding protein
MIVEFDIGSDVLSHALKRTEGMVAVVDRLNGSDAIPLRNMFWASGGDFEEFEAALSDDPTITGFSQLVEEDEARLYRVQYAEDVPEVDAYRAAVELDGSILHAENDGSGWLVRMRFPTRDAVSTFRDRCWAADFHLQIRAVYDRQGRAPQTRYGLTAPQYETLITALENGYFSIPRGATLEDVADELGVSSQAASERLRRGMKSLVANTLATLEAEKTAEAELEATE